ncbi:MAG: hypothetical protein HOP17_00470 [Acidobacteria bacterium]|nr:hypothetical protein [Acidobacteriota bacterium]
MNGKLRSVVRSLRDYEFIWRYGFNFSPSFKYWVSPTNKLGEIEKKVLNDLNRDGIAITSVDGLLTEASGFNELGSAVEGLLLSRKDEIAALASSATDTTKIGSKTFNLELLGSELTFDSSDIFSCFAISPALLNIANAYLRMYAQLRYYNVWYTFATNTAARESQLWHFDREDQYILKVFIYLKDVDIGTGPFTYAPGTHRKGLHWNKKPESFTENNVFRTTDEQMNAVIPQEKWIRATGKKGTVVFADTRGYHKGGEARKDDRLMYTCMFTSPASDSKRLLNYQSSNTIQHLDKKQRLALSIR